MVVRESFCEADGTLTVQEGGPLTIAVGKARIARARLRDVLTQVSIFLHLHRYFGQKYVFRRVVGATAKCPAPECRRIVRFRLDKRRLGVTTETYYGCALHRMPLGA
jgi:hypothetical protein